MYAKLLLDAELLRESPPNDAARRAYITLGGAMTASQMAEWLFPALDAGQRRQLGELAGRPVRSKRELRRYAAQSEPAIRTCQLIASGAMRLHATEYPDMREAYVRVWVGDGVREWSPEDLLGEAISFWRRVLIATGRDRG
jgi:hypothetical protein